MWITDFFLNIPLWVVLLVTLVVLLYLYGTQPFRVWKDLGVSGPAPSIFVGNILEMFDDRVGVRASVRKWQNKYGRMFGIYFCRVPFLVVTDPEALRHVFVKDFNNFTDRFHENDRNLQQRIIKKGIFFEGGADWKRIRRIMSPAFSSGKLKLLTHYMNLTARRLGENLKQCAENGSLAEAKKTFAAFTLGVISGTAFGLDTNSQQNFEDPFIQRAKHMLTFKKSLQVVLGLAGVFPILIPLLRKLGFALLDANDLTYFEKTITALIQERKSHPDKSKDFLQLLMEAEADADDEFVGEKKLTTEEITAQGIVFIIAGYETTSSALQFLCHELAKNQEVQTKLVEEIQEVLGDSTEPEYDKCQNLKYMEAAINEILRMYPPFHLVTRQSKNAWNLKGVSIPAKAVIMIPLSNIGRDPELFPDPDSFRPERFLKESKQEIDPVTFLPFGYGPRACIGMKLAIMTMKIALVHILRSVRIVDVTPRELDIEDYTAILVPRIPIKLHLQAVK